jgi:hypothetical protein
LGQALEKSGRQPAFSPKFKVAFPKLQFWENLCGRKKKSADLTDFKERFLIRAEGV